MNRALALVYTLRARHAARSGYLAWRWARGVPGRARHARAGPRWARGAVMARCTGTMRIGDHLRATRVFVRRALPGRYFNRVPSRLPATDDGNGRSVANDLGSDGSEDVAWGFGPQELSVDASGDRVAEDGGVAGKGATGDGGLTRKRSAAGGNGRAEDGSPAGDDEITGDGSARSDAGTEFTEADVAFLSAPDTPD